MRRMRLMRLLKTRPPFSKSQIERLLMEARDTHSQCCRTRALAALHLFGSGRSLARADAQPINHVGAAGSLMSEGCLQVGAACATLASEGNTMYEQLGALLGLDIGHDQEGCDRPLEESTMHNGHARR